MKFTPRPGSVIVFGILNIAFAVLNAAGFLISSAMIAMTSSSGNSIGNPALKVMRESPAYLTWRTIALPLGVISCVILLLAGIGLLRMKSWGRFLSIGYGIYSIVFGIIGTIVNYFVIVRPLMESVSRSSGPEAAAAIGRAGGGVIGGVIGMVYPALLIFFMMRPKVVAAFKPPQ